MSSPAVAVVATPPSRPGTAGRILRRIAVTFCLLLLSAPFAGAALLWLGSDSSARVTAGTEALRNHLLPTSGATAQTQVDVRLGWLPLTIGRLVVGLTPAPREARTALRSIREANVSVRHWGSNRELPVPTADVAALDSVMERQGWTRMVRVQEAFQTVLVYVAENASRERDLTACVAVSDRDQLVIAGGRFDLEALTELAHGMKGLSPEHRPNWPSQIAGIFGGIH